MSLWRVEVEWWPRLPHKRQREFLTLAGNFGGEWWGGGRVVIPGVEDALELSSSARCHGFFVRMDPAEKKSQP